MRGYFFLFRPAIVPKQTKTGVYKVTILTKEEGELIICLDFNVVSALQPH